MASLAKFASGRGNEKLNLIILQSEADKKGFPLMIIEQFNGSDLPIKNARVYMNGKDNKYFTIKGPIRKLDENGIPLTQPRERDGQFLDQNGMPTNESLAARENVYVTNTETGQLVYSDLGTINIENTKADQTPSKYTYVKAKVFSDQEALLIAQLNYKLKLARESGQDDDAQQIQLQVKETMKESGNFHSLFINSGAGFLQENGFEVRVKTREADSGMGMNQ